MKIKEYKEKKIKFKINNDNYIDNKIQNLKLQQEDYQMNFWIVENELKRQLKNGERQINNDIKKLHNLINIFQSKIITSLYD